MIEIVDTSVTAEDARQGEEDAVFLEGVDEVDPEVGSHLSVLVCI